MHHKRLSLTGCVFALLLSSGAQADNYEQYCNVQGYPSATRQTIVVLDEQLVVAEAGDTNNERNGQWRRFIGRLVDFDAPAQLEQRFMPRERLTLVLARKDGSGVSNVFSGCLPFFSSAEEAKAAKASGYLDMVNRYFGTTPSSAAKRDSAMFISRLGESIREAVQPQSLSHANSGMGNLASSGLVASLRQSPFVNLNRGIPRLILLSNVASYLGEAGGDAVNARKAGLQQGQDAALNLKGAELYTVGDGGGTRQFSHEALEMFFLASHALLVGTSSFGSTPDFLAPPVRIARYQGLIQFPDRQYPVRIRLATDQNGTTVDSWLSVETTREEFVPIKGVMTCDSGTCSFSGDHVFAQVWSSERAKDPVFDESLPFGGARFLDFKTQNDFIRGDIYDPHIKYENAAHGSAKGNHLHVFAHYSAGMF